MPTKEERRGEIAENSKFLTEKLRTRVPERKTRMYIPSEWPRTGSRGSNKQTNIPSELCLVTSQEIPERSARLPRSGVAHGKEGCRSFSVDNLHLLRGSSPTLAAFDDI